MKNAILRNINIGVHQDLSKNEEKLVKLLNFVCLIWYFVTILFIVSDYFIVENYLGVVVGYVLQVLLFFLVQFLQSKRKYFAARILFVSFSHFLVFAFCNVIIPGNFVDLFYILTPLFGLMFFESRIIHYTLLVLSILSFVIPNYLWHNYDPSLFSDPTTIPIFFTSIFLLVTYFRNLNQKNELRLNEQRNIALEDKKLIGDQKKELEDLHRFQNQFFVNIAHEIRTPLTIIKGNINRLSQNEDQEIKETLQLQLNKIQRIVTDVMDLAKMDTNEFSLSTEEVSFSSFINTIFNSFHSSFQSKNIEYQLLDTSDKKNIVLVDRIYFESAVSNILTNALKYTETNGQVSLLIERENDQIILRVIDSGIGIEETELAKIFNRFYQADNSINRSGGSGIGLAFSNEIIKKMSGSLSAKSTIGQGSTFTISLPIASTNSENLIQAEPQQTITHVEIEDTVVIKEKRTVLLVEDNKDMQNYITSILTDYNVVSAYNGIEGIDKLSEHEVDYIITDYMMPKMNGEEFIEKIKNDNNHLPVLMLTAVTDIQTKFRMLRLGIDDYITKPFEEEELLLRIKNGLKNHKNQQEYIKSENIQIEETRQNAITASLLNDLKEFVEKNCPNEKFGVLDICEEFALSQSTLYRKVKSLTGLSTQEFITEVKLQKALEIYNQNETLTLKEIGYKVGFINYTHFGKLFEERFGKQLSESV
jgi:signal transduction histidine kinase/DNA-binding NarL/FixJ family response regulator